jgi:hypothetical protein
MCDPVTAISLGLSGVSALGQADAASAQAGQARVQGQSALTEAAMDKASRDQESKDIMTTASYEANNIKRQALLMRGQIAVAQSGSGVMIGEGSAQAAMDQLDALSSADALAALYSGVNQSVSTRASGQYAMEAGKNKNKAAAAAASSLEEQASWAIVSGLANVAGGAVKTYGKDWFAPTATKVPMPLTAGGVQ